MKPRRANWASTIIALTSALLVSAACGGCLVALLHVCGGCTTIEKVAEKQDAQDDVTNALATDLLHNETRMQAELALRDVKLGETQTQQQYTFEEVMGAKADIAAIQTKLQGGIINYGDPWLMRMIVGGAVLIAVMLYFARAPIKGRG